MMIMCRDVAYDDDDVACDDDDVACDDDDVACDDDEVACHHVSCVSRYCEEDADWRGVM
jgi:hypothetical protein